MFPIMHIRSARPAHIKKQTKGEDAIRIRAYHSSTLDSFLILNGIGYRASTSLSNWDCLFIIAIRAILYSVLFRLDNSLHFDWAAPAPRISSANASNFEAASAFPLSSHSHTVITCHPKASRWALVTSSRCRFLAILVSQNSTLLFGLVAYWHPLCPCQKHPFTIMATPYFGSTISGLPGSFLSCNLNLNPRTCSPFEPKVLV